MSNTYTDSSSSRPSYGESSSSGSSGTPQTPPLPSRGFEAFDVSFGSVSANIRERINDSIISADVDYSMDAVTELTLKIIDRDFDQYRNAAGTGKPKNNLGFAAANYFSIARDVTYVTKTLRSAELSKDGKVKVSLLTILMEIAEVSCSQENGVSTIWTVKCRTKACQQMKRDKTPGSISGNGTVYVAAVAKKFGLKFVGEPTTKNKTISKASGEKEADSVWDVIQKLAGDANFKCFEMDGTLYFASMKWLMYKWGSEALTYPHEVKIGDKTVKKQVTRRYVPIMPGPYGRDFPAMKMPNMKKSDNTPMEAQGDAQIERTNGVSLRPGMTVFIGGIPTFTGYYLITAVNFEERSPNPVGISFATPERKPKEKILNLPVGPLYANTLDAIGPDVIAPYIRAQISSTYQGKQPPQ